jgi:hypothetical protein
MHVVCVDDKWIPGNEDDESAMHHRCLQLCMQIIRKEVPSGELPPAEATCRWPVSSINNTRRTGAVRQNACLGTTAHGPGPVACPDVVN